MVHILIFQYETQFILVSIYASVRSSDKFGFKIKEISLNREKEQTFMIYFENKQYAISAGQVREWINCKKILFIVSLLCFIVKIIVWEVRKFYLLSNRKN